MTRSPTVLSVTGLCTCVLLIASGCTTLGLRGNLSEAKIPTDSTRTLQLVDDLARPWGMNYVRVDGVSLVMGLAGTGSDPRPNSERAMLLNEMKSREVDRPNHVLASPNTSLVVATAYLPPGVRKGDRIDVEVNVPARSNTKSLRDGWLMPTRMREYARVKNRVSSGHVVALAQGSLLIDALFEGEDDDVFLTRGKILGGGVATKSRDMGLLIRDEHLTVKTSIRVGKAINNRFHIYDRGVLRPVATPEKDKFVRLLVHPQYQDNIIRYMRVIQSIPVRYGEDGISGHIHTLATQLMHPATASVAAVKLEALGDDGVPALKTACGSPDSEVQFYAAEALAYMDEADAVDVLVETIHDEPAFRLRALIALGAMTNSESNDALLSLLGDSSAETRYGAFRAITRVHPGDPAVRGEVLGDQFHYHVIDSSGEPLVHVTRSERPELVLFGRDQKLKHPVVLFAGSKIVVRSANENEIVVTRFSTDDEDQKITCPAQLDAVVRAIVELGGTYPHVVQAITGAKSQKCLLSRVEFEALPESGRTYHRSPSNTAPERAVTATSPPTAIRTSTTDQGDLPVVDVSHRDDTPPIPPVVTPDYAPAPDFTQSSAMVELPEIANNEAPVDPAESSKIRETTIPESVGAPFPGKTVDDSGLPPQPREASSVTIADDAQGT